MTPKTSVSKPEVSIEVVSPFSPADLPSLWVWMQPFLDKVSADGGAETLEQFVEGQRERLNRIISWGVYRDGELGGYIEFEPGSPTIGSGHAVFKKAFWGHRTTVPAINQALGAMFVTGVELVMFSPFAKNSAIRALLGRIGARELGILKGRYTQKGVPIDVAVLGLLCDEWVIHNPEFVIQNVPPAPVEEE